MPVSFNGSQVAIEAVKPSGGSARVAEEYLLGGDLGPMVNCDVSGGSVLVKSAEKVATLRSCERKTTAIAVVNALCWRRINEESQRVA